MTEWLKGCEVCNAGLCARFDELIDSGISQRKAAKELEIEQIKVLGEVVYPWDTLRRRYRRNKPSKMGTNVPTYETCAVSDLDKLIVAGRKFSTIYADPPWQYSNQGTRAATNNHYKTMTVKEIACLPVENLTNNNAHLHLWTTNAFLFDAKEIIETWGFKYKSCFVWIKPQMGIGNYWRVSHEFLLLGVRGSQPFLDHHYKSWLEVDRIRHSKKPDEIQDIIEKVSPGPYLEMFGRRTRERWVVWGNEIKRELFNKEAFSEAEL